MSTRKRTSSGRLRQDSDTPLQDDDTRDETPAEPPRRRRRGTSTPAAAAAAAGDGGDEHDNALAAPAAAAGAGRGGSGGGSRSRQAGGIAFDEQDAADMMQKIKGLEDEGELAADKASGLELADASLQAAVSKVVRFLLFRHHEKPGLPVKRQDINDVIMAAACVSKGSRVSKKLPAVVLPLAAAKLARTFGIELRELKRQTAGEGGAAAAGGGAAAAAGAAAGAAAAAAPAAAAAAAASSAGGQSYKLLSLLPVELLGVYGERLAADQERGFITVVLALLQLKQCKMEADELWGHLAQMGIERDSHDAAELFGKTPAKILEGMEHSRYLLSSKQSAPNTQAGVQVVYEWGEAAYGEFGGGLLEGLVDQWLKAREDADS